jgi:hypothetical protein
MESDVQITSERAKTRFVEWGRYQMVKISRTDKRFACLGTKALCEANIKERYDLQEYIFNSPEDFGKEIGQELKIIW